NQFGMYENAIIGDTGVIEITDDMIFELYEKIQVPVEVEPVDINIFENLIMDAIQRSIND
ncbi:MAG: hypothetical protein E6517_09405, partial [Intestinibacter bartlettii]|nr:hypothetical protein [Intestinibacter bartlettii]